MSSAVGHDRNKCLRTSDLRKLVANYFFLTVHIPLTDKVFDNDNTFYLGMGFALLYQSFSVVTALYFRKRLATAYAIGRSGMGLTFALAPFTQLLLNQYAWQGKTHTNL